MSDSERLDWLIEYLSRVYPQLKLRTLRVYGGGYREPSYLPISRENIDLAAERGANMLRNRRALVIK